MNAPKHTCADELISIEDDVAWAAAMETRKTCPACKAKRDALSVSDRRALDKIDLGFLAKALKATGKPRVTIIRGKAKAPKGMQY
jgi:hypothetical protein